MSTANTYTFKTNPAKYGNLHSVDPKFYPFTCDFSVPQDTETLCEATQYAIDLLVGIANTNEFKPENREDAKALLKATQEKLQPEILSHPSKLDVNTFLVYQLQRYAFRIWYRDTKAAREKAKAFSIPAKQEKPKTTKAKAPAKQEKPKTTKAKAPAKQEKAKAPAKQEIAKANEELFVSKLTKAQKKELLLTLMAELLK